MAILQYFSPLTPSLRHKCLINKNFLWKFKKINSLHYTKKYLAGRDNNGRLILFTRSKKKKTKIKIIDSHYNNYGIPGIYCRYEYDSKRSCFIVLVQFKNGIFCYLNSIDTLSIGCFFNSYSLFFFEKQQYAMNTGDRSFIYNIPVNSIINNIEDFFYSGSKYCRSAGTYGILIRKYYNINKALIKLSSGKLKLISIFSKACIGTNSNLEHKLISIGNAGRNRLFGIKPSVRGVAMNPVDHPHGGGEGKKSKKSSPRSAWGKMFKWIKTGSNI